MMLVKIGEGSRTNKWEQVVFPQLNGLFHSCFACLPLTAHGCKQLKHLAVSGLQTQRKMVALNGGNRPPKIKMKETNDTNTTIPSYMTYILN